MWWWWSAIALGLLGPVHAEIGEIHVNSGPSEEVPKPPQDHSALWIHSGTRIYLVLVDAKGKRAGVDPKTLATLETIPNSKCDREFIENRYTGDAQAELDQHLTLEPAKNGVYQLRLTGIQPGPYKIEISAQSKEGSSLPSKDLDGLISEGEEKTFRLSFDPSANSALTVVEEAPRKAG